MNVKLKHIAAIVIVPNLIAGGAGLYKRYVPKATNMAKITSVCDFKCNPVHKRPDLGDRVFSGVFKSLKAGGDYVAGGVKSLFNKTHLPKNTLDLTEHFASQPDTVARIASK